MLPPVKTPAYGNINGLRKIYPSRFSFPSFHRAANINSPLASIELPNHAAIARRPNHRITGFAPKSFGECRHIGKRTIHPEARYRVRIHVDQKALKFGAHIGGPNARPAQEE